MPIPLIGLLALTLAQAPARPEPLSCATDAANKHLVGAALSSFMTKCKMDTTKRCNQYANDKNLFGAARTSYTKKCIEDGIGQ